MKNLYNIIKIITKKLQSEIIKGWRKQNFCLQIIYHFKQKFTCLSFASLLFMFFLVFLTKGKTNLVKLTYWIIFLLSSKFSWKFGESGREWNCPLHTLAKSGWFWLWLCFIFLQKTSSFSISKFWIMPDGYLW